MTDTGRARFTELDGLRGIAAGSVVLYHLFHEYDVYFHPAGGPPPVQFSYGFYGVQLFFLISGFVILMTGRRSDRPRDFAAARFTRLYPTYWVCLTISWVTIALVGVPGLQRTPLEIAVNYSMVQRILGVHDVDGAYWSLSVELVFYAVVLLLLARGRGLPATTVRRLVVGWSILSVVVAALLHARPDDARLHVVGVLTVAEFAPLFVVGMLLLSSRETGRVERLLAPAVAAAAVVTWLLHGLLAAGVVTVLCILFSVVTLLPGVAVLRWRPLVLLGEISYPLYLVHQNVGYALLQRLVGHVDRTVASLLALAVVVPLAWALHVVVEGPLSRRLRNALRPATPPAGAPAQPGHRGRTAASSPSPR